MEKLILLRYVSTSHKTLCRRFCMKMCKFFLAIFLYLMTILWICAYGIVINIRIIFFCCSLMISYTIDRVLMSLEWCQRDIIFVTLKGITILMTLWWYFVIILVCHHFGDYITKCHQNCLHPFAPPLPSSTLLFFFLMKKGQRV